MTVAQAAHTLQTTQKNIRRWLAEGKLEVSYREDGQRAITLQSIQSLQETLHNARSRQAITKPATSKEVPPPLTVLTTCQPLIEVLSGIQDFRRRKGRRYPLASILALSCAAMLCGCHTYSSIALWGRYYGGDLLHELGFNRARIPCELTFYMVFSGLNRTDFENRLAQWIAGIMETLPPRKERLDTDLGFHISTETLDRPSEEVIGSALLTSLSHYLGLPQREVTPNLENEESPLVSRVIEGLVLEGQVLTPHGLAAH